jgi:alpha-D-xyloside xylohydrolase
MKIKSILPVLFLILLSSTTAIAQHFKKTDLGVIATINALEIELQFYSSSSIRIIKFPEGEKFAKQSLSVVKSPQKISFSIKEVDNELILNSKSLQVRLNLNDGRISFFNKEEKLLSETTHGASFIDFNDAGTKTYTVSQSFVLDADETIYGLGQQQQGKMSKRGVKLNMVQGNTDDYIPFFQSVKGYGLFWDNYSPTIFEDNTDSTYFRSDVGDIIDYYFMYGGNADGVIACMRDLTGQVPMFPLWTYGFWQSRERYKGQDELIGVVKKFRELNVPLDGIIQDWQYWGNNYLWNAMEFLNPRFYNPQKMVDDVHDMNAHIIISIWNSFGPKTKQYKELDSIGALFNIETWPQSGVQGWPPRMDYPSGVRVYDAYNPGARDIYWKYLNNGLLSKGIDGWWIDSSEPDHLNIKPSDYDTKSYLGSFRKVRNAFPLMTVGGVAEHQLSQTTDKRLFILTRSAFAGQQRYGANLWSGDVVASWDALLNQISAGLNVSLCGIPHWNSDIGGFFLWNFKNPLQNPDYRELHVRWMQFGTFCPMMRSHGEGSPREIYQFGEKGEPIYDAIEKCIKLRYSLLPYIYSTSWDVTDNQSSMMRALVMDFPHDKMALDINDEFMFGKSILVCPVTTGMYTENGQANFGNIKSRELYLPKGANWIDFWTDEKHNGGQTIRKETPIDIIPLYVKEGSILPIGPNVQYATEKKWDNLELKVYTGANGSFILYEDEFDNYNYENGAYTEIPIIWDDASRKLTIGERKGTYTGMLSNRKFTVILDDGTRKIVNYNGKKLVVKI